MEAYVLPAILFTIVGIILSLCGLSLGPYLICVAYVLLLAGLLLD